MAQVLFDNATQSINQTLTAGVANTFLHLSSGTNQAFVLWIAMPQVTSPGTLTVTYDGVTCPQIGDASFGSAARLICLGCVGVPPGNKTVSVTSSAGIAMCDLDAESFTSANQAGGATTFNGFASQAGGDTASTSVNITSGSTNDMVASCTTSLTNNHISSGAGQTIRFENNSGASNSAGSTKAGATGLVTMTETWSGSTSLNDHDVAGVNISAGVTSEPGPDVEDLTGAMVGM